ncbi:hypothetical protein NQZ68_038055 [Dissostichus eleginoides]|nr:hypothetical protein NQZ68_038055 [Dissostichus eleginoides]
MVCVHDATTVLANLLDSCVVSLHLMLTQTKRKEKWSCTDSAPLLLIRNPWIGGCHGFLGHMRGFPVARSSRRRRCLDEKSRAIFIQEKERNRCGGIADWVA